MFASERMISLRLLRRARNLDGRRGKQMWAHLWPKFQRWEETVSEKAEVDAQEMRERNFIRFPNGMYLRPEKPEWVKPPKDYADRTRRDSNIFPMDLLTNHTQMRYLDHSVDNVVRFRRHKHFQRLQYDQRFLTERLLMLGPDLAAAHFLVHRGAAVKFVGDDAWYKRDKNERYSLPGRKVEGLFLEAIDASDTELMFEGITNLFELRKLRMVRLANCEYADDWMLSRLVAATGETLELLDLTNCSRVSAKGLMALKQARKLQRLRLDGLDRIRDIHKAALVLEDSIPGLLTSGLDFDEGVQRLEDEQRLLEHPRVLVDAKNNILAEDDRGRLFLVGGRASQSQHVCVDDEDKPMWRSTIRREVPALTVEEFDQIDDLSGGRLRHLLVGSPSGYEWSQQVETILQHEYRLNLERGLRTDLRLLPREERRKLLGDGRDSSLPPSSQEVVPAQHETGSQTSRLASRLFKAITA